MSYDEASEPGRSSWARPAAAVAGVVLAAIACLHAVWALGSSWPFGDREAMAKVVWGGPLATFPSPAATMFVAVLIGAAALVVTGRGGLWGSWVPRWVFAAGTWTLATVLFLRALVYGLGSIGSDAVNSAWERALFTPLCFVLAALCAIVGRDAGRHRVSTVSGAGHWRAAMLRPGTGPDQRVRVPSGDTQSGTARSTMPTDGGPKRHGGGPRHIPG